MFGKITIASNIYGIVLASTRSLGIPEYKCNFQKEKEKLHPKPP